MIDDPALAGFSDFCYHRYDHLDGMVHQVKLMLPVTFPTWESISSETAHRLQENAKKAKLEQDAEDGILNPDSSIEANSSQPSPPSRRRTGNETDVRWARAALERSSSKLAKYVPNGEVMVYAWDEPLKLIAPTRTPDKEFLDRSKKIFESISKTGNTRQVLSFSREKLEEICHTLHAAHPNFQSVIAQLRKELLLTIARKLPTRISPLLLVGPPGVGKTHFAKSLASVLGTSVIALSYDTALTSRTLLGSDRNWGNTATGKIFDAVVMGKHANPVLVLDELDKANPETTNGQQHPLSSLHSLLEPVSSRSVTDISVEFTFDASHIIWICTANDPEKIPHTLRSRFSEHVIAEPTAAQAYRLALVMLASVHKEMALPEFSPPSPALAKHIAHLNAREMRRAIERAYATAIEEQSNCLKPHHLSPAQNLMDDKPPTDQLH